MIVFLKSKQLYLIFVKIYLMKTTYLGIMIASFLLVACKQSAANKDAKEEIIQESGMRDMQIKTAHLLFKPNLFKIKLDNDANVILLDVRTPEELAQSGNIKGAKNHDFYAEDFKSNIDAMDRETPVMLYCRSGGRSGKAAAMLKEMGFKQVYDLNGGYTAWLAAGYQ
tara:strand:- start:11005 stop:11508 length:504 start_codon:yes stop_codon:yes gene_type:complete